MDKILLEDFLAVISPYVKIGNPYIQRKEYYYVYEYHSILPDMDMVLQIKHKEGISFIDNIRLFTWEGGWNHLQKVIVLDLLNSKNEIDRIFFQVSNTLVDKDWIKKISPDIPKGGQCYLNIEDEEHNIYNIIFNYLNTVYPGYMREQQIKSVID